MKLNEAQLIKSLLEEDYEAIDCLIKEYGINAIDRDQRSILMNCVIENKINFVSNILKSEEVEVNSQDYQGLTALHLAVENDLLEMVQTVVK